MTGTVHLINPERGMVAIETVGHGFTIIELLSATNIEVGDVNESSPDTGLGHQTYINRTKGSHMRAYGQNHGVMSAQLRQQLLIRDY